MEDMERLVEKFVQSSSRRNHHLEGDGGCEILEALFETLGYRNNGFRFGGPIEQFLSDNPGAQEALVNWIIELELPEWKQALVDAVGEKGEGEDEDEDEDG